MNPDNLIPVRVVVLPPRRPRAVEAVYWFVQGAVCGGVALWAALHWLAGVL